MSTFFNFHNRTISSLKSWYLLTFSSSFFVTLLSPGIATSIIHPLLCKYYYYYYYYCYYYLADLCCKCQNTGVFKSCLCVREGRHRTDCYPLRIGRCCNLPLTSNSTLSQASSDDLDSHVDVSHCDPVLSPSHSPLRSASSATSITQPDPAATLLGPSNN